MTQGDPSFITPRQAAARLARGERLAFVDVRAADHVSRSGCRIPGALRAEPGAAARAAAALPRDAVLVVYGEDGRSEPPEALAGALLARGLDARVLAGGFAGWSELRYPTELAVGRSRPVAAPPRIATRPALRLVSSPRP